MKLLKFGLGKGRLLVLSLIILVSAGYVFWHKDGIVDKIIPSKVESEPGPTVFIHAAKQFAFTVPEKWTIVEPLGGKQTLVYPTGSQIDSDTAQALIDKDVIIVETAINKKDSFEALIDEMKSSAEKTGASVETENKDYGNLKAASLNVKGKTNYQQILFNTPTIIVLTAKINHPIVNDLAKSLTIDLSQYAEKVATATTLMRDTKQNIAAGKYNDVYNAASESLKKQKKEDEFANLLKDVSVDLNNNVIIWGIYLNNTGIGTAVNVINQDKILRRGSFFFVKDGDQYRLDGLRLSGKISYDKAKSTTPDANATPTTETKTKK